MMGLVNLFNRVAYSADADALKQVNLFSDVQFLRADDVAADDFRGAGFKIYFAPGETPGAKGAWMLAKAGGQSRPLSVAPGGQFKSAMLQNWVEGVKAALGTISPR